MPLTVQPSTDLYGSGNAPSTSAWQNAPPGNAFGSIPASSTAQITAPAAVGTATALGQGVYSQLPGYGKDISNIGSNITAETAGQLPQDVVTQLTNEAAARGIANGTGGAAVNQDLLKTLGLNSLQLTQMGQTGLDAALGQLPGAALYQNPAFYPSSSENLGAQQQNAVNAAAPDPRAAALAALAAAGSGFAAGGTGGVSLPGAPATTSSVFPGGAQSNPNLAVLNQLAQAYAPPGSSSLVTGNTVGGGAGSIGTGQGYTYFGDEDNQTGAGASETALSPDQLDESENFPDTSGIPFSDFYSDSN